MPFLKKSRQNIRRDPDLYSLNQLSLSILGFNQDRDLTFVSRHLSRILGQNILKPGMPLPEVLQKLKPFLHKTDAEALICRFRKDPRWDPTDTPIRYKLNGRHYRSRISSDIFRSRKDNGITTLYYLKEKKEMAHPAEEGNDPVHTDGALPEPDAPPVLTGQLEAYLQASAGKGKQAALVLLSIDRYERLKQSLGSAEAARLNAFLLERLKGIQVDPEIISLHWQQGRFVLICPFITSIAELQDRLQRIRGIFDQPFILNKRVLTIQGSMGISLGNGLVDGNKSLADQAELALAVAIQRGGNQFVLYSHELKDGQHRQGLILQSLPYALKKGEFSLQYQPRMNAKGELVSVETLLRWRHPALGAVSPCEFIPLAEKSGDIISLGEWVLAEACKQAREWMKQGINLIVSVNISPIQIHQPDSCRTIAAILENTGLPPDKLELEVTETTLLNQLDKTIGSLRRLHEQGIRISLDDFGTGFSSLSYLGAFPIDILKIDRTFIQDIHSNDNHRSVVEAIASLARSFGYKIIAEGVETEEQLEILKKIGCDEFQGYYYHKPAPARNIAALCSFNQGKGNLRPTLESAGT